MLRLIFGIWLLRTLLRPRRRYWRGPYMGMRYRRGPWGPFWW